MRKLALILLVAALACSPAAAEAPVSAWAYHTEGLVVLQNRDYSVERLFDKEQNIVCYIATNNNWRNLPPAIHCERGIE